MKINTPSNKRTKKYLSALVIVVVLALAGYATYAKIYNTWPFVSDRQSQNQDSADHDSPKPSSDTSSPTQTPGPDNATKTPVNNEPTANQPNTDTVAANITAANQNDTALQIRTLIETVTSEGECNLTLSNNNRTVMRTADIQPLANSSTCKGFDIPTSELQPGVWDVTIDITIGNQKAKLTTTVTIT